MEVKEGIEIRAGRITYKGGDIIPDEVLKKYPHLKKYGKESKESSTKAEASE